MSTPNAVTVIKNDHTGKEVWRYEGQIIERGSDYIILEALFNRDDRNDGYVVWRRGDRFVETFYTNRWHNVFEVHDVADDHIKGWYCNMARPAEIEGNIVQSDDLALDLFVHPDGRTALLDDEEFAALPISDAERGHVWDAVDKLIVQAKEGKPPFQIVKA